MIRIIGLLSIFCSIVSAVSLPTATEVIPIIISGGQNGDFITHPITNKVMNSGSAVIWAPDVNDIRDAVAAANAATRSANGLPSTTSGDVTAWSLGSPSEFTGSFRVSPYIFGNKSFNWYFYARLNGNQALVNYVQIQLSITDVGFRSAYIRATTNTASLRYYQQYATLAQSIDEDTSALSNALAPVPHFFNRSGGNTTQRQHYTGAVDTQANTFAFNEPGGGGLQSFGYE